MKHFIDSTGEVFAYDDDALKLDWVQERLKDKREMTDDEVHRHHNPPPTAESVRAQRDGLLQQLDAVVSNPLRWGDLTDKQQNSIKAYRQKLLHVPAQEGFPLSVNWPSKPKSLE